MITENVYKVLEDEGVVSIVTQNSETGAHVVNTWNSYITITEDYHILIPAGRMFTTEKNLGDDNRILLTFGSRNVMGKFSLGTGFLVEGVGQFTSEGALFESMKERFEWIRALLIVTPKEVTQTL